MLIALTPVTRKRGFIIYRFFNIGEILDVLHLYFCVGSLWVSNSVNMFRSYEFVTKAGPFELLKNI